MDCIFCKIIKGEIPCYKIYEDDNVISFLDINPVTKGHLLVIPKKHVIRFKDLDDNTCIVLFNAIRKILEKVESNVSEHYNISINQGKFAGQVVEHLHIHIIPRYEDDGLEMWEGKQLKNIEATELLNKLRC